MELGNAFLSGVLWHWFGLGMQLLWWIEYHVVANRETRQLLNSLRILLLRWLLIGFSCSCGISFGCNFFFFLISTNFRFFFIVLSIPGQHWYSFGIPTNSSASHWINWHSSIGTNIEHYASPLHGTGLWKFIVYPRLKADYGGNLVIDTFFF